MKEATIQKLCAKLADAVPDKTTGHFYRPDPRGFPEGSGRIRKADSRLVGLLLKTAKGMGLDMRARWLGWRGTDATPLLERKLRAVSIMGLGKTAPIGWSWGNDSASNVDAKRIEAVADLIAKLIQGGR